VGSLEALGRHPYAGHSAVLGNVERPWQDVDEVLSRFGRAVDEARLKYERFVREGAELGRRPELVGGGLRRSCGAWLERAGRMRDQEPLAYDERVLGSPDFVADVLAEADWERRQALRKARAGIAELAARIVKMTGVTEERLRSGGKWPEAVAARRALIRVAIGELGYSGAAVARYLRVAPSTVNRQAADGELSALARRLLEDVARLIS
jgi:hypothetical protein